MHWLLLSLFRECSRPFFAFVAGDKVMPWDHAELKTPIPAGLFSWNGRLQILLAGLGFLCALMLFVYFSYEHYRMRSTMKRSPVRRSLWTTDQVNACLIPLGIGLAFAALHFLR